MLPVPASAVQMAPSAPVVATRPASSAPRGSAVIAPSPRATARARPDEGSAGSHGGPPAFADVLDEARQADVIGPERGTGAHADAADASVAGADRAADEAESSTGAAPSPAPAQPHPVPSTPWLLLALGIGGLNGRSEPGAEAEADTTFESSAQEGAALEANVAGQVQPAAEMAIGGASVPTPSLSTDVVPADGASAGVEPAVGASIGDSHAVVASSTPQASGVAGPVPAEAVEATAPPVASAEASADLAPVARGDAEHLPVPLSPHQSRHAAGRGISAPVEDATVPSAEAVDDPQLTSAEQVAGPSVSAPRASAPGKAVSQFAGEPERRGESGIAVATPEATPPVEAAGDVRTPAWASARATEVLMRLAHAGGDQETGRGARIGSSPETAPAPIVPTSIGLGSAAAPTVTTIEAQGLTPATGEQVVQQLVSSMKLQWKNGVGEARLHLRPDALGQVSVSLRVESGAVTAVVRAESAQVQEWILQHQQTLRDQLEASGLTLGELVVEPDDRGQGDAREQATHQRRRQPPRRTTDVETPRFETLL